MQKLIVIDIIINGEIVNANATFKQHIFEKLFSKILNIQRFKDMLFKCCICIYDLSIDNYVNDNEFLHAVTHLA